MELIVILLLYTLDFPWCCILIFMMLAFLFPLILVK